MEKSWNFISPEKWGTLVSAWGGGGGVCENTAFPELRLRAVKYSSVKTRNQSICLRENYVGIFQNVPGEGGLFSCVCLLLARLESAYSSIWGALQIWGHYLGKTN